MLKSSYFSPQINLRDKNYQFCNILASVCYYKKMCSFCQAAIDKKIIIGILAFGVDDNGKSRK
jgi:hypothetical protein